MWTSPRKTTKACPYLLHQREVVIANHAVTINAAKMKHG